MYNNKMNDILVIFDILVQNMAPDDHVRIFFKNQLSKHILSYIF